MNISKKNYLRGVGGVMDLAPARNLRQLVPRRSGAERMASHFTHVGESVSRACSSFADNGSTTVTKTKAA
jgi:hypothetical protein